jgi:REP element-mobilizing transposase RayT
MSNHVHLIIGTDDMKLQDIIRDLKKYTSKSVIAAIKENPKESRRKWMLKMFEEAGSKNSNNQRYQFWQQHNKPIVLNNAGIFEQKLNYIHLNPVKAGFVNCEEDYPYSSAGDYSGIKSLVKMELA